MQYDERGGYTLRLAEPPESEQEGVNVAAEGVKASAILTEEPGKGAVLSGVLDGRKFSANVAVVDETLHIFTKVLQPWFFFWESKKSHEKSIPP